MPFVQDFAVSTATWAKLPKGRELSQIPTEGQAPRRPKSLGEHHPPPIGSGSKIKHDDAGGRVTSR